MIRSFPWRNMLPFLRYPSIFILFIRILSSELTLPPKTIRNLASSLLLIELSKTSVKKTNCLLFKMPILISKRFLMSNFLICLSLVLLEADNIFDNDNRNQRLFFVEHLLSWINFSPCIPWGIL
jgi:hypothetical protein